MNRRTIAVALFASALTFMPGAPARTVGAQEATTLRIATLAPRDSAWMRVFNAWANSLSQATGGRLRLRFYAGGSQGDERDFVRKIRIGQLDGAAVTSVGLGLIVRSALVLQAPGLFESYAQLDRARAALDADFRGQFDAAGMTLLGWGDVGRGRIFTSRDIRRPSDLRTARPWVWRDDELIAEYMTVVGANGVRLGVPEVLPALATGQVDTVVTSATAASALQWHTRMTRVTQQGFSMVVGAVLMKKSVVDALPADLRATLLTTATQASATLVTRIRRDDDRYFTAMTTTHGLSTIDMTPHSGEWREAAATTRAHLAGRLYPRELLDRIAAAVGTAP